MERAHERQPAARQKRVPPHHGHDGLVDVHDVVAALRECPARREHGVRGQRDVGDGAVGGDPDRPAEAGEALGFGDLLGPGAAVQASGESVVGVPGREYVGFVSARAQLASERVDVPGDPPRIRPRVRREQRDPHDPTLYPPAAPVAGRGPRCDCDNP